MMDRCLIQVGPGVFIDPLAMREVKPSDELILLNEKGYRHLGMTMSQRKSMKRLCEAGFVRMKMVTPKVWLLDLKSWAEHLQRVSDDPWFWEEDGKNMKKYRGTYR